MNSPHPYAAAASHLTAATSNLQEARNAHARAYQGNGSDTTTAESIRATVRALHRYLDETSQPHTVPEEEEQETSLERAHRSYETAKAEANRAIAEAAAAEVAAHRAQTATAEAQRASAASQEKWIAANNYRIRTAHEANRAEAALEAATTNAATTAK
jgi:hypothetical protein